MKYGREDAQTPAQTTEEKLQNYFLYFQLL